MERRLIQIDDDYINNLANERLIRKLELPCSIVSFLDPEEALQHLETLKVPYDLLLLDINMPRLSGWEFLERYRTLPLHTPVVMVSSSIDPNDLKRANAHPLVSSYYSKPLNQVHFKEMLSRIGLKVA